MVVLKSPGPLPLFDHMWHPNAQQEFSGATVRFGDVLDLESIRRAAFQDKVDVVVSCLASRTGGSGRISRFSAVVHTGLEAVDQPRSVGSTPWDLGNAWQWLVHIIIIIPLLIC